MDPILIYFADHGVDFWAFLKFAGILLLGAMLLAGLLRFIFGRKTLIGHAVSSAIAIIFIYAVIMVIASLTPQHEWLVAPLPFVRFAGNTVTFFPFRGSVYTAVSAELLSMIILSFLVNLVDSWMPNKKNLFLWLLWKFVTVVLGLGLHYLVTWLFNRYLPMGIVVYAPVILLVILLVMLLTGALRFVVGALLTTVNPVIAGLYTFFFATLVGKQITKAVLTTGIMLGILSLLQELGIYSLSLAAAAMVAYIPFLLLLILVWYVVNKFF